MDLSSIKTYVGRDWELVQERIGNVLRSDIDLLNVTNGTVLSHSGKQLRPLLSILVARACSGGVINDTSVRYAAASGFFTMPLCCMMMWLMTVTSGVEFLR